MRIERLVWNILSLILTGLVFPLILLWVGYAQVNPLLKGEFTQELGSIEVSYIQMAKFIEKSLPEFAWQPRWYLGYPMAILYTPLVPVVEFVAHQLLNWSYSHAYRVLTAVAYIGTLVSVYYFGKTLLKNSAAGLISALSYGILPSLIAFLYPEVAQDHMADSLIEPRRFTILVRWGEGPHIVSLLFLPLAALFLVKFLRNGNKWSLFGGALFTTLVILTNSIGAWALALLVFTLLIGMSAEKPHLWRQILGRALLFFTLSVGLVAFWFNPLFLATFFREGGGALAYWRSQFPWGFLAIVAGLVIYYYFCKKLLSRLTGAGESILFFLIMFFLVNTYYASGSEKIELVPQVLRLTTEVDLAASLILGLVVAAIGRVLGKINSYLYYIGMFILVIFAGFILGVRQLQLQQELPQFTKPAESSKIDLKTTGEYEVAKKLESVVTGQERVFVPGNYSFYLNYFTDIPQLRGALFQSSIHPWPDHIYYQVTNGEDGDISLAWLKIANVGWFVLSGPRDIYHDFKVPVSKFDDTLDFVEEADGDRYYKVPLKNTSLAKAVSTEIQKVSKPKNAIDKNPIFDYVHYLETSQNQLTLTEKANGTYEVKGSVDSGEVVLVQEAYAPGWQAKDQRSGRLEVKSDPLGFILIKPKTPGVQDIELTYSKPVSVWCGWVVAILTAGGIILILVRRRKPFFDAAPTTPIKPSESID